MLYEHDWLRYAPTNDGVLLWTFSLDASIKISNVTDIKSWGLSTMVDSVRRMPLGNNPMVALSGGVDSQAACILMKLAGVQFTAVTMKFHGGLNAMDYLIAQEFCDKWHIPHKLVEMDAISFLTTSLPQYVERYQCPSPQFGLHFAFFEKVITEYNPSCLVCGGTTPFFEGGKLVFRLTRAQNSWTTFAEVTGVTMVGNFLGWSLDIALPMMMTVPTAHMYAPHGMDDRYLDKVTGMRSLGIDVSPQDQKYTGFENIKLWFEEHTGDPWAFENMFRTPSQQIVPDLNGELKIHKSINQQLVRLNHQYRNI